MKNKIILLICLIASAVSLVGCGNGDFENKTNNSFLGGNIYVYTDPDTNVDYLCFTAGYKGGITLRVNPDGTPYISE